MKKDHPLNGESSINIAHIGFAPFENPEIAYAVVIPYVTTDYKNVPKANNEIARAAADKYFELTKSRVNDSTSEILPPYTATEVEEGTGE
nr:hypothetical protein [Planococcus glaciei]